MLDLLNEEGIKYTEKPQVDFEKEWEKVVTLTNTPVFPTLLVNGEYLSPRRDFNQPQQAVQIIKIIGKKGFKFPSNEKRLIEKIKTLESYTQQSQMAVNQQLQTLHKRLDPITQFIDKLKEEIESEDE